MNKTKKTKKTIVDMALEDEPEALRSGLSWLYGYLEECAAKEKNKDENAESQLIEEEIQACGGYKQLK